jgi:chaperone modulatory protein CbpM
MAKDNKEPIALECEELTCLSLQEVTYSFGISEKIILEIIDEGIVNAQKNEQNEWLFDSEAISRIRTILRLYQDLGVNLAGAALAVQLLNEIEHLKMLLNYR